MSIQLELELCKEDVDEEEIKKNEEEQKVILEDIKKSNLLILEQSAKVLEHSHQKK